MLATSTRFTVGDESGRLWAQGRLFLSGMLKLIMRRRVPPISHPGNKPGMRITVIQRSRKDTGGERQMYNPHENRPKVDKTGENKAGIITRFEQFCTVLSGMFRTETPVNPLWFWTFLTETGINVRSRECCRFAPFYLFYWV